MLQNLVIRKIRVCVAQIPTFLYTELYCLRTHSQNSHWKNANWIFQILKRHFDEWMQFTSLKQSEDHWNGPKQWTVKFVHSIPIHIQINHLFILFTMNFLLLLALKHVTLLGGE